MKSCCIIIPIYHSIPSYEEKLSIKRCLSVLNDYDIFFIYPDNMNLSNYQIYTNANFIAFHSRFFKSPKTYSRLLLSEDFYKPFMKYEYMLIAQTDTYILNTKYTLNQFIKMNYDYWGAPWPKGPFYKPYTIKDYLKKIIIRHPENCHVGNGGFSLRKVQTTFSLVKSKRYFIKILWHFNEDMFFSYLALDEKNKYHSAPVNLAATFAIENNMKEEILYGNKPFALHAWSKYFTPEEIFEIEHSLKY